MQNPAWDNNIKSAIEGISVFKRKVESKIVDVTLILQNHSLTNCIQSVYTAASLDEEFCAS